MDDCEALRNALPELSDAPTPMRQRRSKVAKVRQPDRDELAGASSTHDVVDTKSDGSLFAACGQSSNISDATVEFICLRYLQPRRWWCLRGLCKGWRDLLDGSSQQSGRGLLTALTEGAGPLRSANEEISFAGCLYCAAHHRRPEASQLLLRPLTMRGWCRSIFATAVVKETLNTCAVSGDVDGCKLLLQLCDAPSNANVMLSKADVKEALEVATEWECMQPGSAPADCREQISQLLGAAIAEDAA
eukprot:TRINITY_DN8531_c0_g1_i1.p1 TRINITY_DN8531_c0_g1~~TRINITY_DN8531_c0_g1_i1.p1  ORF type:complete len:246 (-),score=35.36 TRINITY_DN8531_c0_g1_i1:264-1001(-)